MQTKGSIMKKSINAWILPLTLVSCLAALDGSTRIALAQSVTVKRQVEIDVFSGQPNPVFTLTESEAADVQRWLMPAADTPIAGASDSTGQTPETIFPSKLGHVGIVLWEYDADGRVLSRTEIAGRSVLARQKSQLPRQTTSSDDVERKLVDLALSKAVINAELHGKINEKIAKRANGSDPAAR